MRWIKWLRCLWLGHQWEIVRFDAHFGCLQCDQCGRREYVRDVALNKALDEWVRLSQQVAQRYQRGIDDTTKGGV